MAQATPSARRPYHHGNLRAALVEAGYELACANGTDAVTLRAVTRAVGVSPTAAYRHFADLEDLRFAIGVHAMSRLARSIERHQAAGGDDPRRLLEAVGVGYVAFALDNPGAFEVALFGLVRMEHVGLAEGRGESGRTAFELLLDALTRLVVAGRLDPAAIDAAAVQCWSSVHGFASLATRGPLRNYPRETLDQMAGRLASDVVAGLPHPPTTQT